MMGTFPSIIDSRVQFEELTSDLLRINSIVISDNVPRVSILLDTDDLKYLDFLRVCDKEKMEMIPEYQYFLADRIYLRCILKFKMPVRLEIGFIIEVDKYYYALVLMAAEDFIGLGFCSEDYKKEKGMFTLMAIPSINKDVLMGATILDGLSKIVEEDWEAKRIAQEILVRANISL